MREGKALLRWCAAAPDAPHGGQALLPAAPRLGCMGFRVQCTRVWSSGLGAGWVQGFRFDQMFVGLGVPGVPGGPGVQGSGVRAY